MVVILEWSLVELLTYNISQRAKLANVTTRPRGHRSQGSGVLTEGLKYELKKKKKKNSSHNVQAVVDTKMTLFHYLALKMLSAMLNETAFISCHV